MIRFLRWAGMRVAAFFSAGLLLAGCATAPIAEPAGTLAGSVAADPFTLLAEVDRLAAVDLWPGFDPSTIPLAIYDGERTLLFRHPRPPAGFEPLPGRSDVMAFAGRYPAVVGNSSIDLGGAGTATLMPLAAAVPLRSHAALLIHEAFHVYQRHRHPGWSANEVELFTYPVEDPRLLTLRRLEMKALRRAFASGTQEETACWARAALEHRQERFSTIPAGSATYERQTELNEGLATYVEWRARGDANAFELPSEEFAPEAVRQRAYQTGLALALLLDRFSPGWRHALEQDETASLDGLLSNAVAARSSRGSPCTFTRRERERIQAVATADVRALATRRAEQRRGFLGQPGWAVVIASGRVPLFPQGFDPLNVLLVAPREVLHTRFLKLGNDAGVVEVLGRDVLTSAAGEHPLFNGVRSLTLTGFADEPVVTIRNGVLTLEADGVAAEFRGAALERDVHTLTIRLSNMP
jgi:hypothetical protein